MENIHCLLEPKDLEEDLVDPKAHWDILEECKVRERRIETWYQRQSTLDGCVEEFGRRSAETKGCMTNLVKLCAAENYLCIWAPVQGS